MYAEKTTFTAKLFSVVPSKGPTLIRYDMKNTQGQLSSRNVIRRKPIDKKKPIV